MEDILGSVFTLPLQHPVLIFSIILFIILFAPILLNKLKIPHLIGLIIAGAIIGPNGFNLLLRDSSIVLFGTVGLLYIMFVAGIEIDINDLKKNSKKSLIFGLYTFIIPMGLGIITSIYILNFSLTTSVLLASMYASHTLISYPIVSKLGITKNRAVNITIGGTIVTVTLALLVLAVITGMVKGELKNDFWIQLSVSVLVFAFIVFYIFPIVARWFMKRYSDSVSQYIFILAMVFLASFIAVAAGIEAIIGAFMAGLALNKMVPKNSALMNRIEFVGNALFIPFFLIGIGMLVDYRVFFQDMNALIVAATMTIVATLSKYIAAWLAQKSFSFSRDERSLIFGLSNAQAAATLAAVTIGYNIIIGYTDMGLPIRLFNDSVLNGTIVMILITCTIASFATQKGAQNIALKEQIKNNDEVDIEERILIPVRNPKTTEELINLSLLIKSPGTKNELYSTVIVNPDMKNEEEKLAKTLLEHASQIASGNDTILHEIIESDYNIINGISSVVNQERITDIILGIHDRKVTSDSFLGSLTHGILQNCNTTTFIYQSIQPITTIKRHIIVVPENAEKEIGFPFWLIKMWNISKNSSSKLIFYASEQTCSYIKSIKEKHPIQAEFINFEDWNDFLIIAKDIQTDDCLNIILSRKNNISHHSNMNKIPGLLEKYFNHTNIILIYPIQTGINKEAHQSIINSSVWEPLKNNLDIFDEVGQIIGKIFKWR